MAKKRKKRRRRGGLGRLLRPMSVILAAVAMVAALTLFFKVEHITVTGASRYGAEEIIAASGVETGDNLILLDRYRVAQRIYTSLPYITDVRPKQEFPNTLNIEVTETRAMAAIQGSGAYWLLSGDGKILEAVDEPAAADYLQIIGVQAAEPAEGAEEIEALIARRAEAKKAKDWTKADAIRAQLKEMGVEIKDTPNGVEWKRI